MNENGKAQLELTHAHFMERRLKHKMLISVWFTVLMAFSLFMTIGAMLVRCPEGKSLVVPLALSLVILVAGSAVLVGLGSEIRELKTWQGRIKAIVERHGLFVDDDKGEESASMTRTTITPAPSTRYTEPSLDDVRGFPRP